MNEQDLNRSPQDAEKGHKLKELFNKNGDLTALLRRKLLFEAAAACCVCLIVVAALFGITAAWYTNVVKSDAMSIQAEEFGFQGTVELGEDNGAIPAAPGESGTLANVTINNESEKPVRVRLDVNKAGSEDAGPNDEELQKRLYFYTLENGQKKWINSRQGYIFTMDGGKTLALDQVHWMWVYDLLGYYVLCSYDAESGTLVEEEFLEPVEYDLDTAVFDSETGLLQDISIAIPEGKTIPGAVPGLKGYYLEERVGTTKAIMLRLLTKDEIQAAIRYDTDTLGGAEPVIFTPELIFTGENIKPENGEEAAGEQNQP